MTEQQFRKVLTTTVRGLMGSDWDKSKRLVAANVDTIALKIRWSGSDFAIQSMKHFALYITDNV